MASLEGIEFVKFKSFGSLGFEIVGIERYEIILSRDQYPFCIPVQAPFTT